MSARHAQILMVAATLCLMGNAKCQDELSSVQAVDESSSSKSLQEKLAAMGRAADERASIIHGEYCSPKAPNSHEAVYPQELFGTGIHGTTVLILELNPCGEVREALFEKSSRNRVLDSAARNAAMGWVFDPEQAGFSPGRGGRVRISVVFHPQAAPFRVP